jgi:hypothetical protein
VAVNVKALPAQPGLNPEVNAMAMDGVTLAVMLIVIALDVAVVGLAHAAFDVITQVTTCPLVNEEVVNVALFVPAFTPFTFHW